MFASENANAVKGLKLFSTIIESQDHKRVQRIIDLKLQSTWTGLTANFHIFEVIAQSAFGFEVIAMPVNITAQTWCDFNLFKAEQ